MLSLRSFLESVVKKGNLEVVFASGQRVRFGDGSGPKVCIQFMDRLAEQLVLVNPSLQLGELYMDGRVVMIESNIYEFIALMKMNAIRKLLPFSYKFFLALPHATQWVKNIVRKSFERAQIATTYDLKTDMYKLFLDKDMHYSCGFFTKPGMTLEEAQLEKKRLVTAKALIRPEHRVLDVGCGWGGLALYIAEITGAHVTGVNLSSEQVAVARQRALNRGLQDQIDFQNVNYRDTQGKFDRIVSVGFMCHVGKGNLDILFRKLYSVLDKKGIGIIHAIGRPVASAAQSGFIGKYIFPGGYIVSISEAAQAIERAGFLIKDIEVLPLHYAETLRCWRERLVANWDIAKSLYDERICRMFEFYFASCESAFRHDRVMIAHYQFAKHQDVVPNKRDYIWTELERLKALEAENLNQDEVMPVENATGPTVASFSL